MTQGFAVVKDDTVVNVIVLERDQDWQGGAEIVAITPDRRIGIGWTRDAAGVWSPPPQPVDAEEVGV